MKSSFELDSYQIILIFNRVKIFVDEGIFAYVYVESAKSYTSSR